MVVGKLFVAVWRKLPFPSNVLKFIASRSAASGGILSVGSDQLKLQKPTLIDHRVTEYVIRFRSVPLLKRY